jgi:hypothetical protein
MRLAPGRDCICILDISLGGRWYVGWRNRSWRCLWRHRSGRRPRRWAARPSGWWAARPRGWWAARPRGWWAARPSGWWAARPSGWWAARSSGWWAARLRGCVVGFGGRRCGLGIRAGERRSLRFGRRFVWPGQRPRSDWCVRRAIRSVCDLRPQSVWRGESFGRVGIVARTRPARDGSTIARG